MTQAALRQPIAVGKYFLDRGKVSPQQLELALQHRAEFGLKLGQSLVELGFVTEADMVEALRHQARFPCIHLTSGIVDPRVAARLGEAASRRLKALALNQVAEYVTVALEDPSDPLALEELARTLDARVFPVYAEPSIILACIGHVFGAGQAKSGGHEVQRARPLRSAPPAPSVPAAEAPAAADAPDDRAVVECVRGFLQQAFERGASDIHLEPRRDQLSVRFRVHGALHEHARLAGAWAKPVTDCLKALAHIEGGQDEASHGNALPAAREGGIPFVFRKQNYEVRIATLPTLHGESVVLHVLGGPRTERGLEHLGLGPEHLTRLEPVLAQRDGLLVVAGPAGSGCRTTQQALLVHLATPDRKAVACAHEAAELEGVLHLPAPRGLDPVSHVHALLGQDPDLLTVPEIEGRDLALATLEAALSGRSVLAVLRVRGALGALARLVRLGLEPYLLADALRLVVGQRLVRRICGECKTPIVPDEALCARLELPSDDASWFEGEGCAACHGTGYSGRLGLFEVLSVTSTVRRELEKGADPEAIARAARADGFVDLREHGLRQARAGLTTLHEVLVATAGDRG